MPNYNFQPAGSEPDCRNCQWNRECPPCDPEDQPEPPSSEEGSDEWHCCHKDEEAGALLVDPESNGVLIRRVMYDFVPVEVSNPLFPVYNGYIDGWDAAGMLNFVFRDPQATDITDVPFLGSFMLWGRDHPDHLQMVCTSSEFGGSEGASSEVLSSDVFDVEVNEPRPTAPVLVRWMAVQGGYFCQRPEEGSSEEQSSDGVWVDQGYVAVEKNAGTLICAQGASSEESSEGGSGEMTFLEEHDLLPTISEVAAEFSSDGRLLRAAWGGLRQVERNCNQLPLLEQNRNHWKWTRDLARKTDSGCILPMMTQAGSTTFPESLRDKFNLWLLHFNSAGECMHICKYLTLEGCTVDLDLDGQGPCPCDVEACLKLRYSFSPMIPHSPPCPATIEVGCPDAQYFHLNHGGLLPCDGDDPADGLSCFYEAISSPGGEPGPENPPSECQDLWIEEATEPGGPPDSVKWCKYATLQETCE